MSFEQDGFCAVCTSRWRSHGLPKHFEKSFGQDGFYEVLTPKDFEKLRTRRKILWTRCPLKRPSDEMASALKPQNQELFITFSTHEGPSLKTKNFLDPEGPIIRRVSGPEPWWLIIRRGSGSATAFAGFSSHQTLTTTVVARFSSHRTLITQTRQPA